MQHSAWHALIKEQLPEGYFAKINHFLDEVYASGTIYPPREKVFNAIQTTDLADVKVVILGQDPYHGYGQAMGLSFSVPDNIPAPPSLINIFKEIEDDLGIIMSGRPNLEGWARQGVLLLNAILTVRAGQPASHSRIGWQEFTDVVIRCLSDNCSGIVFLLWGNFARSKKDLIDSSKHFVLEAAHPSPLARGAFFGCRHFSRTNSILIDEGKTPIDWQL